MSELSDMEQFEQRQEAIALQQLREQEAFLLLPRVLAYMESTLCESCGADDPAEIELLHGIRALIGGE